MRRQCPVAISRATRPESFGRLWRHGTLDPRSSGRRGRPGTTSRDDGGHRPRGRRVSVPTVSKVLNGRSDVAPETRRRVEAAIRDHGYQRTSTVDAPCAAARGHLPRTRERVGAGDRPRRGARRRPAPPGRRPVRDAGPADAGSRLDRGCPRPSAARRHRRLLRPERHDAGAAAHAGHPVRRRRPDRRAAPRHAVDRGDQLERRPDRDPPPARPRASADRGRRRTGGDPVQPGADGRLPGRHGRRRRADRPAAPEPRTVPRRRGRRPGAGGCCALPDPPTAIITGNDLQALGVYQAAREARLHIPEDVSVVGFDDLPIARWVSPPLTTIRQPLFEMAESRRRARPRPGRGHPAGAAADGAGHRAHRPREHGAAGRTDLRSTRPARTGGRRRFESSGAGTVGRSAPTDRMAIQAADADAGSAELDPVEVHAARVSRNTRKYSCVPLSAIGNVWLA